VNASSSRLDLLDALRGFAIVSIMLLHNIEHFDLYFTPDGAPAWLAAIDRVVWDSMFFLFGGKSYAIFALLFGVTFYLQFQSRAQRGEDFRPRYAWRLTLLLGFGLLNSMVYHGDILSIYAVLGLALIPVARWRSAVVGGIAVAGILPGLIEFRRQTGRPGIVGLFWPRQRIYETRHAVGRLVRQPHQW
jgi:uncharacterized protein